MKVKSVSLPAGGSAMLPSFQKRKQEKLDCRSTDCKIIPAYMGWLLHTDILSETERSEQLLGASPSDLSSSCNDVY